MEAVECGAAALGSVLSFYGKWVALEELRSACGVSRDGSKASNMLKAARRYGLVAKGFKREPEGLRGLPTPAILHWNFNHFVVFEGIHKGRVYLNDPGMGPRIVSERELDESFTGVVLVFQPGEAFEPGGERRSLLPALLRRVRTSRVGVAFVFLAGLALVVPNLVRPVFSKVFVDSILLDSRLDWLKPLLIAMGITALVTGALTWIQQKYLLRLETKIALSGTSSFLWHVLRLPVEFFNQRYAGEIAGRVAINDKVAQLLSRDLATNLIGTVMIVFFGIVLFRYDALLTLSGIAVVAANMIALRLVSRRRIDAHRRLLQEKGKLHGATVGGLKTIETLKATGGEMDLFLRLSGYQAKVVNIRQDLAQHTLVLDAVPPLLTAINTAVILGVGSLRVMNGAMSIGGLLAFQVLMASFIGPISRLVSLGATLQTAQGDMDRLDDVLRYPAQTVFATEPGDDDESDTVRLTGHLQLRGLTFGYSRFSPPLIQDFDLDLEPGSRVALVGTSGSGKSTIAKLISGLYQPWSGDIHFDGRPRDDIPATVMTNSLAVVDQSIALFEGSIRENLTLWDTTIPLPEVVAAAKDAAIHEDIAARAGGYDSLVSEAGANFSGGQQQRLEIARALVRRPSILILDEGTSALDPTTESAIDENLRRRGCTCLIVAHRLSTIRDADEIILMHQGKVIERGNHRTLMDAGGAYAQLIAME